MILFCFLDISTASTRSLDCSMGFGKESRNGDGVSAILDQPEPEPLEVLCEVNGYVIPALIDTGAQVTIMSEACAKRCHLTSFIDDRYSGLALGVGITRIMGQIRQIPLRIGPVIFNSKISVLNGAHFDFVIGLDFLTRFRCEVSVRDHILRLQARGRAIRIPFISRNKNLPRFHEEFDEKSHFKVHDSDPYSHSQRKDSIIACGNIDSGEHFEYSSNGGDDMDPDYFPDLSSAPISLEGI